MNFCMCKTKIIVLLILLLNSFSFGQIQSVNKKNTLLGGFTWQNGDFFETWDNIKLPMSDFSPQDFIAITICSNSPLPVALVTAAGPTFFAVKDVAQRGILFADKETLDITDESYLATTNHIFYLRQTKNCRLLKDKSADTAFWIVRPNNEFPEFVEARKATDLSSFDVVSSDKYFSVETTIKKALLDGSYQDGQKLTPEIYKIALAKTVSFMKESRTAIAVIKIPYWGRYPTKTIISNALQAQKFLKDGGIGNYRVFVRKISFGIDAEMMKYNDKYPAISIVYEK